MSETHGSIKTARYAANKLWTPEMSLDMLGRDWAVLDGPFTFLYPNDSVPASIYPGSAYMEDLSIEFPPDWDLDDSFDDLQCSVHLRMLANVSAVDAGFNIRLEDPTATYYSSNALVTGTSTVTIDLFLNIPSGAVPTGRSTFRLEVTPSSSGTNSVNVSKAVGVADCHIFVRLEP